MARGVRTRGGVWVLDKDAFKRIPNESGPVGACEDAAYVSAAHASALANERYTVTTVRGSFRSYVRVTGQEPDTGGFYRGRKTQALWHSRPTYGGFR